MTTAIHADDLGAATSTRLSFVRHAQSESNVANEIRGERTCTGLTTLGHEQANCLARRIELDHDDDPITQVYSTPLRRAVDTATPVARILGLGIRYLPSWRYATYGAAEGRSWREAHEEFPGIHPALHPDRPIAEGAETMRAFHESMRTAIVELVRRHPGEHSLVFGSTENLMAVEEIMLAGSAAGRAEPIEVDGRPYRHHDLGSGARAVVTCWAAHGLGAAQRLRTFACRATTQPFPRDTGAGHVNMIISSSVMATTVLVGGVGFVGRGERRQRWCRGGCFSP